MKYTTKDYIIILIISIICTIGLFNQYVVVKILSLAMLLLLALGFIMPWIRKKRKQ
jgi:hypothetical protein